MHLLLKTKDSKLRWWKFRNLSAYFETFEEFLGHSNWCFLTKQITTANFLSSIFQQHSNHLKQRILLWEALVYKDSFLLYVPFTLSSAKTATKTTVQCYTIWLAYINASIIFIYHLQHTSSTLVHSAPKINFQLNIILNSASQLIFKTNFCEQMRRLLSFQTFKYDTLLLHSCHAPYLCGIPWGIEWNSHHSKHQKLHCQTKCSFKIKIFSELLLFYLFSLVVP